VIALTEKPAVSSNTPATDAGFELLARIAIDPANDERYPSVTAAPRQWVGRDCP
jgi:hypothetical protein